MNGSKNIYDVLCVTLLLVFGYQIKAQEYLKPLGGNINVVYTPVQSNRLANKISGMALYDTLPFFDDFSYAYKSPCPTAKHWQDSSVYINTGFAIAPLSLGVATFDGLNKKGYPYSISASVSTSSPADYLTSRPINLFKKGAYSYSPADSIYLSFYYQAEGRGEAPEANDSLAVDFYKPKQNKWQKVWGRKGYNPSAVDTNFYRVMIAIKDTAYFDSLFVFRIRNKATLSGSLDHWHVDYVYLNKGRFIADTVIEDLTHAYKPTSFLKNYSVMPYRQYNAIEMGTNFRNYFRSNFTVNKFMNYKYTVYDNASAVVYTENLGAVGAPGVQPFMNNGYYSGMPHANPSLTMSPFATTLTDTTSYKIEHVLSTTGDAISANDTVIHMQKFSNYYAYDDGTAEVGYYQNTYGAKAAVRFTLNVFDTLRAVNIFFDPIIDGTVIQGSSFRVMLWADGNNGPGNLLYKDSLVYPTYLQGTYNMVPTYTLTSCLPLTVGTYYVGIQQTTNKGLNIGFDKNTNHSDALYYDIGNGWTQSAIKGSIMINPMMGCYVPPPVVGIREYNQNQFFSLYPNPAQNTLTIKALVDGMENTTVSIISSLGQTVLEVPFLNYKTIDISELTNGIYFVYINGTTINGSPKKLIISK